MAKKSKSRSARKVETWEEKEARLLCKTVYDHLAYYIQVQLPEEKFVCTTPLRNPSPLNLSKSSYSKDIHAKRCTKRTGRNAPKAATSSNILSSKSKDHTTDDDPSSKSSVSDANDPSSKLSTPANVTSPKSWVQTANESSFSGQRKNGKVTLGRTKISRPTLSRSSTQSCRAITPRNMKKSFNGYKNQLAFEESPYRTETYQIQCGRKRQTSIMRREAERVASNASQLLRNMSLNEIMTVQKYRSPCKSLMRCSSSLSDHPNGMLTSNRAIKYAATHDDREAARKYFAEKKKKEKQKRRTHQENERSRLLLSKSYQRKYRRPTRIHSSDVESPSSDSSEEISGSFSSLTTQSNKSDFLVDSESRSSRSSSQSSETDTTHSSTDETTKHKSHGKPKPEVHTPQVQRPAEHLNEKLQFAKVERKEYGGFTATKREQEVTSYPPVPNVNGLSSHAGIVEYRKDSAIASQSDDLEKSTSETHFQMNQVPEKDSENTHYPQPANEKASIYEPPTEQTSSDSHSDSSLQGDDPISHIVTAPQNPQSSDDASSTTSSIRRLIAEARSSLSVLGSSSSSED